jgi:predicted ATPase/DNA-binding SARP family transcriptional activator
VNSVWSSPPRLAVLGPVVLQTTAGIAVEPAGRLGRALLIALALAPSRDSAAALSESALIEDVWGDAAPGGARQALQTLVSRTRAASEAGLIIRRASGYALALTQSEIDLGRAIVLAREARSSAAAGAHEEALRAADAALALWRGEPGTDAEPAPAAEALSRGSMQLREDLLACRAACLRQLGDAAGAAAILEKLVASHPLDEHRIAALMSALDAAGRRSDALTLFADTRSRLREELGVSPGPDLVSANAELLRPPASVPTPEPERAPGEVSESARAVPASPNELIGRGDDIDAVLALQEHARLVTILGTGGLGKTRLALEIARRTAMPSVAFVELAGVRAVDDVPLALASALGVRDVTAARRLAEVRADDRTRILGVLRERPWLLVVDNCEHLIAAAATWVADLLSEVSDLRVLTTSRTPLEIAGEQIYALEPLSVLSGGVGVPPGAAVRLFLERARAARPSAHLPIDVVARLCARLDGLPLAIELAAARVRMLSVEQIETRLADRFALLTTGDRAAPDRHRTLRAVVEWSWDLLGADARVAFCRLSVFPDGFSTDAAQHVIGNSGDVIELLNALVTQSLITARDDTEESAIRYRMLETMREFGLEELRRTERSDEALGRVVDWADVTARGLLSEWSGPRQPHVMRVARAEQENFLFALRSAIERADPAASTGVFGLVACMLSVMDGHEDVAVFAPEIARLTVGWTPDDEHALAAVVGILLTAVTSSITGNARVAYRARARLRAWSRAHVALPPAVEATVQLVVELRDPLEMPRRLAELAGSNDPATALIGALMGGQMAENGGDVVAARGEYLAAWELARERGDVWAAAMCAGSLTTIDVQAGRLDSALRWSEEASAGMALLGVGTAFGDWNRALVLIAMGRMSEARDALVHLGDAPEARRNGSEFVGIAHLGLAEVARLSGDPLVARTEYLAAVAALEGRSPGQNPWTLMVLSWGAVASATDRVLTGEESDENFMTLRTRTVELGAQRSAMLDLPVLGAAILGIAAAEAARAGTSDLARRDEILQLLALAEWLGARADLPGMRIDGVRQHLASEGWDVRPAGTDPSTFTREEAAAEAIRLIARPPLPPAR